MILKSLLLKMCSWLTMMNYELKTKTRTMFHDKSLLPKMCSWSWSKTFKRKPKTKSGKLLENENRKPLLHPLLWGCPVQMIIALRTAENAGETEMTDVDRGPHLHLQNLLNDLASAHALSLLRRSPEPASAPHLHRFLPRPNARSILRTRLIRVTADRDPHLTLVTTPNKANLIKDKDLHTRHLLRFTAVNPS